MSHIFYINNDNSGFTGVGGSYSTGSAKEMESEPVEFLGGESGEPDTGGCCGGSSADIDISGCCDQLVDNGDGTFTFTPLLDPPFTVYGGLSSVTHNAGNYVFEDEEGTSTTIGYDITAVGAEIRLLSQAGTQTSAVNVCTLINDNCNVGVALSLVSGNQLKLHDGAGDVLSAVILPSGASGGETVTMISQNIPGGSFTYTNELGAPELVSICTLAYSGCDLGTELTYTSGTRTLELLNGKGDSISSVILPSGYTTDITRSGGNYLYSNGAGQTLTIGYDINTSGSSIQLVDASGTVASSVDVCTLVTSNCNVATNLTIVGDTLSLRDGQNDVLATAAVPVTSITRSGGNYLYDNDNGQTLTIGYDIDTVGTAIRLLDASGTVASSVDVCALITANCNVGTSLSISTSNLSLLDGQTDTLSTVALPVTTISRSGGNYIYSNGAGQSLTIGYDIQANGASIELIDASGTVASSVNVCTLVTSNCDVATSLNLVSGDKIRLMDGQGDMLSVVTLPASSACIAPVDYGIVGTIPTSVPGPASHHFWALEHSGGTLSLTASAGNLAAEITGAGDCDEFHILNKGPDDMTWENGYGYTYTFFEGDIVSFVKILGTNYDLI